MLELATKPVSKLSTISSLFEMLHAKDILYCHWKSNEHLEASMTGETDLDVLFAEDQKEKLELLLGQLGFKRFNAIKQKQYRDIVDFIGLDPGSGKLIHLHTHYRLTMGEPYLKGYQLNIEDQVLNSRVFNEQFGIYCIDPAFELILLFLRESLKLRHREVFSMYFKNRIHCNEYVLREYCWLKDRVTDTEIRTILKRTFSNYAAMFEIVTGEFNTRQLHKLRSVIKQEKKLKRLYAPATALVYRWYREAIVIISKKLALIFGKPILFKRINPRGGIVVAVIGADGSGKSTVTQNLVNTFEGKLDLFKIYFGRGDGKISLGRKLLISLKNKFTLRKDNTEVKYQQKRPAHEKNGFLRSLYKCIEASFVALEKRNNMKLVKAAKKKGALVICDRYPQNQSMGYNDGPLLHDLVHSKNLLLRAIANMESKVYTKAEGNPPDIVFKLVADAAVVESRKPGETPLEKLKIKISGIKQLRFGAPCKVITVDATRPLNEVLYIIKKEIWNIL